MSLNSRLESNKKRGLQSCVGIRDQGLGTTDYGLGLRISRGLEVHVASGLGTGVGVVSGFWLGDNVVSGLGLGVDMVSGL